MVSWRLGLRFTDDESQPIDTVNAYRFSCPHCEQHLEGDERYAGRTINCPACQGELVVPANPSTPASAPVSTSAPSSPAAGLKLRISQSSHPGPAPSARSKQAIGSRPVRPPVSHARVGAKIKDALVTLAVLVVAGVGLVLVVPAISRHWGPQEQNKNDPAPAGERRSHLGELNSVMDATEDLNSGGGADRIVRGPGAASGQTRTNRGPGMGKRTRAAPESGAGAGPRRGPANVILKQRARELGAGRPSGPDGNN